MLTHTILQLPVHDPLSERININVGDRGFETNKIVRDRYVSPQFWTNKKGNSTATPTQACNFYIERSLTVMFFQGTFQSMKEPGLFLPGSGSFHTIRTSLRILFFSKDKIYKRKFLGKQTY